MKTATEPFKTRIISILRIGRTIIRTMFLLKWIDIDVTNILASRYAKTTRQSTTNILVTRKPSHTTTCKINKDVMHTSCRVAVMSFIIPLFAFWYRNETTFPFSEFSWTSSLSTFPFSSCQRSLSFRSSTSTIHMSSTFRRSSYISFPSAIHRTIMSLPNPIVSLISITDILTRNLTTTFHT